VNVTNVREIMSDEPLFTVEELRRALKGLDGDARLTFSGGLSFYRLKRWGDKEFVVEFNEPQGYLDEKFKARNPNVKVVFIRTDNIAWDESGVVVEPVDVGVR